MTIEKTFVCIRYIFILTSGMDQLDHGIMIFVRPQVRQDIPIPYHQFLCPTLRKCLEFLTRLVMCFTSYVMYLLSPEAYRTLSLAEKK